MIYYEGFKHVGQDSHVVRVDGDDISDLLTMGEVDAPRGYTWGDMDLKGQRKLAFDLIQDATQDSYLAAKYSWDFVNCFVKGWTGRFMISQDQIQRWAVLKSMTAQLKREEETL